MQLQHHQLRTARCPAWRVRQVQHTCSSTAAHQCHHPASTVPQPYHNPCQRTPAPAAHRPGHHSSTGHAGSAWSAAAPAAAAWWAQKKRCDLSKGRAGKSWMCGQHAPGISSTSQSPPGSAQVHQWCSTTTARPTRTSWQMCVRGFQGTVVESVTRNETAQHCRSTVLVCCIYACLRTGLSAAAAGCLLGLRAGQLRQHTS